MLGIPVPLLSCMAAAACLEAGESRTHAAWSICSSRKCPWVMLLIPNPGTLARLTLLQAQSFSGCPPLSAGVGEGGIQEEVRRLN